MWYRLKNNPKIEYSTDFSFFLKNQIAIFKSGSLYSFQSRLESKVFYQSRAVLRENYTFSVKECDDICERIHKEILEGKHGEGELVN